MIKPVPPEPIRLGGGPSYPAPVAPEGDGWQAAYWLMQQQFAAETRRTSTLIAALHDLGHRTTLPHPDCQGCRALLAVGTIDPAPSVPAPDSEVAP